LVISYLLLSKFGEIASGFEWIFISWPEGYCHLIGRVLRRLGYWHSFRVDHYDELPRQSGGDYQMFRPV